MPPQRKRQTVGFYSSGKGKNRKVRPIISGKRAGRRKTNNMTTASVVNQQKMRTSSKLPRVAEVRLLRAEGPAHECGKWQSFKTVDEANHQLTRNSLTAPSTGGYDKHDFKIIMDDGQVYEGRYDLHYGEHGDIRGHIKDHTTSVMNSDPKQITWLTDDDRERAKNMLNLIKKDEEISNRNPQSFEQIHIPPAKPQPKENAYSLDTNGRGFKGKKYEQTKNTPIKDIAKLVKKELKEQYPGFKFSVKTSHYSMGQAIDVEIVDVPKGFKALKRKDPNDKGRWPVVGYSKDGAKVVNGAEKIVQQYNRDNSDPMTDYYDVKFSSSVDYGYDKVRTPEYKRLGIK